MNSEATFLAAIVGILLTARLFREGAQRLGQPAVMDQLAAGILLGPSIFGLVWPQAQQAVFPDDPAQKAMLDAIAEFGVLLLLLLIGMDADAKLMRTAGRPALAISATGVFIRFARGASLGFMLPREFLPEPNRRMAGAPTSRRGAEVAIELARASRAELTILSLTPVASPRSSVAERRRRALTRRNDEAAIKEVVEFADHRDQSARVRSRRSNDWPAAILEEADAANSSLIVLGVAARPSEALLFRETANRLLETSSRSLLFVAS